MAGGASKANAKSTASKKLQAAKEKLLKKTSENEAKKKGREKMRRIAQEADTEDEVEVLGKTPSKKSSGRPKGGYEVSWKNPITDGGSSSEEEDCMEEEEDQESEHNTTLLESPEDSDSDIEVKKPKKRTVDSSNDSSSDEEVIQKSSRKSRHQRSKMDMPLSEIVPKALWPRGMTKEAIDLLDLPRLERLQAHDLALRKLEGETESKNPGKVVDETTPSMTKVLIPAAYHDFVKKFSAGQFLHFPLSPPESWWKYVAVSYDEITPEFGHEERGVTGKIARSTWVSAHNRKWIGQLQFWSSQNIYGSKLRKESRMTMVRGSIKITTNENDSFSELRTVQEAYEALNNYRSAWNRLWPWDWTPVSS